MSFSLFGQWDIPSIDLELQLIGFILLFCYLVLLLWILYRERQHLLRLPTRSVLVWAACILLALILGNILTVHSPAVGETGCVSLAMLTGIPIMLAGTVGIFPAALTGLIAGSVQSVWVSHHIFAPFESASWGIVVAYLIRQNYRGRFLRLLRKPFVAAPIASLIAWITHGLSCVSYKEGYILSSALYYAEPMLAILPFVLLSGVIVGLIIQALFLMIPSLIPTKQGLRTPPYARSLKSQVLFVIVPTIVIIILILFFVVNTTATQVAIQQSITAAARDSDNAAERIPFIRQTGQSLLDQFTEDEGLWSPSSEVRQQRLARLIRTMGFFRELIILDHTLNPLDAYPSYDTPGFKLGKDEKTLAQRVVTNGTFQISPVHRLDNGSYVISFLAPVAQPGDAPDGVLSGREEIESSPMMRDVLKSLQGTMNAGKGFVVDERDLIVAHPDREEMLTTWALPAKPDRLWRQTDNMRAYDETDATGNRWLVYYSEVAGSPWKTAIYIPYQAILDQAAEISTPFVVILLLVGLILVALIPILSVRFTHPIETLSKAAVQIAQGKMDTPIDVTGDNEVGHLGNAFETMRLSLQTRLKELALLLKVSQAVSANLHMEGNLEPILAGIMEATPAVCARIILVSSQGSPTREISVRRPGRISWKQAQAFSGPLLRLAEDRRAIKIQDASIYSGLFSEKTSTALGFPLLVKDKLIGALLVEYRSRSDFATSELEFLSTLAGQAAVAIESARLFEAIENERRRLVTILTSTNDAIIVTDDHNRVLLVNPAAQQTFGLEITEVIGQSILQLPTAPELVNLLVKSAEEPAISTQEIALPDGRTLYASASPIGNDSEPHQGYVVVMRDITHLKEIDNMKSEFVSTVSHDLRSPLTFMKGYTSLIISSGPLNDKQTEFVYKIREGITKMTELIDNLLDIGKIEAGIGVSMAQCQLGTILRDLAMELGTRARAKGLDLSLELPSDLPAITIDATLVRQALTNLIDNAIKYTDQGTIHVTANQADNEIIVSVTDSGIGIPAANLPRLFEKFYRVKTREAVKKRGSGLGLSIVKSITELHNGRVWVESEPSRGSTFFLALPLSDEREN